MKIAPMTEKIVFQKQTVSVDTLGNRTNTWADYFTCYATVSRETSVASMEETTARTYNDVSRVCFTVRYSSETIAVTTTGYRIRHGSDLYDIEGVDHMSYKKQGLMFTCRKERR